MRGLRNPRHRACVLSVLFGALAALMVVSLPAPHRPLEYLVAGTFATAGSLAAGYALFATGHL